MNPAILVVFSSTIGIIGYLVSNDIMFYIGGSISFIDLFRYTVLTTIKKNKQEISFIRETKCFQRYQNSPVYYAKNDNELKSLINQYILCDITVRIITYTTILGLLFLLFSWEAFIWVGILGGFGYLITITQQIITNKKHNKDRFSS